MNPPNDIIQDQPKRLIAQGANGRTYRTFKGALRRCNRDGQILQRVRMTKKQRRKAKQISADDGAQSGGGVDSLS